MTNIVVLIIYVVLMTLILRARPLEKLIALLKSKFKTHRRC